MYEHRNSLLPNDPGLKGSGSMQSIDRRNSNESDESDNLSQYFRSSISRKSSLVTTNDFSHTDLSREHTQNTMPVDHSLEDASLRLKSFIKSTDEVQQSEDVFRNNSMSISKPDEKRSISKGSFKFLKKKTKSVDFPNEVSGKFQVIKYCLFTQLFFSQLMHVKMIMSVISSYKSDMTVTVNNWLYELYKQRIYLRKMQMVIQIHLSKFIYCQEESMFVFKLPKDIYDAFCD